MVALPDDAADSRRRVSRTGIVLADPRLVSTASRLGPAVVKQALGTAQARLPRTAEALPEDYAVELRATQADETTCSCGA
jgi:hypothetical protein